MKLSKWIVFLMFFSAALFLLHGNADDKAEYTDSEELPYFMSLKIIGDNKIKLVMREHSLVDSSYYTTPEDRVFVLNAGETATIHVNKQEDSKTLFEFIGIENDRILINQYAVKNNENRYSFRYKMLPYPNMRKTKGSEWPDNETMKMFMTALVSASKSEKKDTSYQYSEGLNLFYSVQIVDEQKLQLKMSELLLKNPKDGLVFFLNKNEPKKFTLPLDDKTSWIFDLEFKGLDNGQILIKEDVYMFDVKAGENYIRFNPYTVDETKSLLFNMDDHWH